MPKLYVNQSRLIYFNQKFMLKEDRIKTISWPLCFNGAFSRQIRVFPFWANNFTRRFFFPLTTLPGLLPRIFFLNFNYLLWTYMELSPPSALLNDILDFFFWKPIDWAWNSWIQTFKLLTSNNFFFFFFDFIGIYIWQK